MIFFCLKHNKVKRKTKVIYTCRDKRKAHNLDYELVSSCRAGRHIIMMASMMYGMHNIDIANQLV
jgi:hypothetical protein